MSCILLLINLLIDSAFYLVKRSKKIARFNLNVIVLKLFVLVHSMFRYLMHLEMIEYILTLHSQKL